MSNTTGPNTTTTASATITSIPGPAFPIPGSSSSNGGASVNATSTTTTTTAMSTSTSTTTTLPTGPTTITANPQSETATATYIANERVLCYHGPLIYEAKVMKVKVFDETNTVTGAVGAHYLVHYKGWKQTWDEWVPPTRLLKMTETNLAEQKRLQQSMPGAMGHGTGGGGGSGTGRGAGRGAGAAHGGGGGGAAVGGGGGYGNKDQVGTRARKDGRGTKRAREEDENAKKPEMKLTIPEVLKARLVDDWEAVTKNNQLLTLPRSPSVAELLSQFSEYVRKNQPPHLKEPKLVIQTVIDGLQTYFDRALGNCLLYRFERIQYAGIRRQYWTGTHVVIGQEKPMSMIYGAEHLLRMLVNLPQMIAQTNLDPESVAMIRDYSNELMHWMALEKERIFQKEYENANVQYQNLSRS